MAINNSVARAMTGIGLIAILGSLFFYCPPFVLSLLFLCMMFGMIGELKEMISCKLFFCVLVPFYLIIPCAILIYFNQSIIYKKLLLYLFLIVFTFDTACYLGGKGYSKFWTTHKIVPAISPGKSWQGFCAGFFATTTLVYLITLQHHQVTTMQIVIFSLFVCIIAFAGDIFESYLKRCAGIKDSGTILPGHGGLLDRFDAILFVSYFFFIFKDYLIIVL